MHRLSIVLTLAGLSGCADKLDDRLAELDARVEVDCGFVGECTSQAKATEAVECLRNNLAAGIGAKATIELGLDPVDFVYAIDGAYVSLNGYYELDAGPFFTEYQCGGVELSGVSPCFTASSVDCEEIREWTD
jgi:hypothetical protein